MMLRCAHDASRISDGEDTAGWNRRIGRRATVICRHPAVCEPCGKTEKSVPQSVNRFFFCPTIRQEREISDFALTTQRGPAPSIHSLHDLDPHGTESDSGLVHRYRP